MMSKLISALSLLFAPVLAWSQAAKTEVPIEPTVGGGAVIAFGVVVVVGIVIFVIYMSKANANKDEDNPAK